MFLKGCLDTVLETSGSLNAEITVVFYASVTKTSANQDWEERGGEEGKLIKQQHSQSSPISYKQFQNGRTLVCALRCGLGASHGPNPETAAECLT